MLSEMNKIWHKLENKDKTDLLPLSVVCRRREQGRRRQPPMKKIVVDMAYFVKGFKKVVEDLPYLFRVSKKLLRTWHICLEFQKGHVIFFNA